MSKRSSWPKESIGQVRKSDIPSDSQFLSPEKFKLSVKFQIGRGFWLLAPKRLVLQKMYEATKVAVCSKL